MQHNLEVRQQLHIRHYQRVPLKPGMLRELAQHLRLDTRHCQVMHQVLLHLDTLHNLEVRPRQGMRQDRELQLRLDIRHCPEMHQVQLQLDTLHNLGVRLKQGMRQDRELQLRLDMRHYQVMHQVLLQLDTLHNLGVRLRQDTLRELALHLRLDTRHCLVMHQVLLHLDLQHNPEVQQQLHIRHYQRVPLKPGMLRELAQHLRLDTRHCQVMHQVLLHLDTQLNQVARLNQVMQHYQELHRHLQVERVSIQQGLSRVEHSGQLVMLQEAHSLVGHSLVMDQD